MSIINSLAYSLKKTPKFSKILLSGSKHLDRYESYAYSFAFWPYPFSCFLDCWLLFWLDAQLSFRKFLSSSSCDLPLPFLLYKSSVSRILCLPFFMVNFLVSVETLWRVSHSAWTEEDFSKEMKIELDLKTVYEFSRKHFPMQSAYIITHKH